MRDLNRIDGILKQIGDIWKRQVDMRLGQLLLNVLQDPALYYVEDEELVRRLQNFYGDVDHNKEVKSKDRP